MSWLPVLTLMLQADNLAITIECKKPEIWLKPWHMGIHLRVRSETYLMNTNMTGFRIDLQKSLRPCALSESSLSIIRRVKYRLLCGLRLALNAGRLSLLEYPHGIKKSIVENTRALLQCLRAGLTYLVKWFDTGQRSSTLSLKRWDKKAFQHTKRRDSLTSSFR